MSLDDRPEDALRALHRRASAALDERPDARVRDAVLRHARDRVDAGATRAPTPTASYAWPRALAAALLVSVGAGLIATRALRDDPDRVLARVDDRIVRAAPGPGTTAAPAPAATAAAAAPREPAAYADGVTRPSAANATAAPGAAAQARAPSTSAGPRLSRPDARERRPAFATSAADAGSAARVATERRPPDESDAAQADAPPALGASAAPSPPGAAALAPRSSDGDDANAAPRTAPKLSRLVAPTAPAAPARPHEPLVAAAARVRDAPDRDAAAALARLRGAAAVTAHLVAPGTAFRAAPTAATLRQAGCRYATRDPAAIAALVDVVVAARREAGDERDEGDAGTADARATAPTRHAPHDLVSFEFADGSRALLVVDEPFAADVTGALDRRPLRFDDALPARLRAWARGVGAAANDVPARCEAMDRGTD